MTDIIDGGQAPQPQDTITDTNLLGGGDAPAKFNDWRDNVPPKFIKDGNVNNDALVQSYLHLEKRMGSGDAPPTAVDGYKLTLPDGTKDEDFAEFKDKALALGLNNAQAQGVLEQFIESTKELSSELTMTPEKAEVSLREVWKDAAEFDKNLGLARKAAKVYANDINMDAVGNNPEVIRLLAKIGSELGEDSPVNQSAILSGNDIKSLMTSESYLNPNHPQHAQTVARVTAHYQNSYR